MEGSIPDAAIAHKASTAKANLHHSCRHTLPTPSAPFNRESGSAGVRRKLCRPRPPCPAGRRAALEAKFARALGLLDEFCLTSLRPPPRRTGLLFQCSNAGHQALVLRPIGRGACTGFPKPRTTRFSVHESPSAHSEIAVVRGFSPLRRGSFRKAPARSLGVDSVFAKNPGQPAILCIGEGENAAKRGLSLVFLESGGWRRSMSLWESKPPYADRSGPSPAARPCICYTFIVTVGHV